MKPFLCARWTNLINITYAVNPDVLKPYLPSGVELDIEQGKAFLSIVPFQFLDTRFLGIKAPFYQDFSELNLRFYVHDKDHKGVVFIREFAPGRLMNTVANTFYKEHYERAQILSKVEGDEKEIRVSYILERNGIPYSIQAKAFRNTFIPEAQTREYFLEHRYYGFSRNGKGKTFKFRVAHPEWELYTLYDYSAGLDFQELFGERFAFLNRQDPVNAMLIKGSDVQMFPLQALPQKSPAVIQQGSSFPVRNS
ncbi:MAG: YqjF family protein [Bacteroidia bacterium]